MLLSNSAFALPVPVQLFALLTSSLGMFFRSCSLSWTMASTPYSPMAGKQPEPHSGPRRLGTTESFCPESCHTKPPGHRPQLILFLFLKLLI